MSTLFSRAVMSKFLGFVFSSVLLLVLISGCDPLYPISLSNESGDSISVFLNRRIPSNSDDIFIIQDSVGATYMVPNGARMDLGTAIAELENDIRFDTIVIKTNNKEIVATNQSQSLIFSIRIGHSYTFFDQKD